MAQSVLTLMDTEGNEIQPRCAIVTPFEADGMAVMLARIVPHWAGGGDALDELYHFMQYLQFKYKVDLEPSLEALEDEIDNFDGDAALAEA
jgi:hypothetical protein